MKAFLQFILIIVLSVLIMLFVCTLVPWCFELMKFSGESARYFFGNP